MNPVRVFESVFKRGDLRVAALVLFVAVAACDRSPAPITLTLVPASGTTPATIRVQGLSTPEIAAVRAASMTRTGWQQMFALTVSGNDALPVTGEYIVDSDSLEFRPRFPLDPGRKYRVRFDTSRLPVPRADGVITTDVEVPSAAAGPVTRVTGVSPTGVWPENTLRFYIYFSAPMSRSSALEFVRLEYEGGQEVKEAFLPLDVELWNADRTRVTVFFDPGRVKRGIRPNVELGRALISGRRYAITVDAAWRDAAGHPIAPGFRHEFAAGPAEERPVTPADWRIEPPPTNSTNALVVSFPWTLDRALVQRALGVAGADGNPVAGDAVIDQDDRHWRFTPAQPWRAGAYSLVVLSILEDPAGNRVGRSFEIEMFKAPKEEQKERVLVPFQLK